MHVQIKERGMIHGFIKKILLILSVKKKEDNYKVSFHLAFPPNPNNYWGIYHMQNGLPDPWGEGAKDNWYYYECCTR